MFELPLDMIPEKGYVIAVFEDKTLFEPYKLNEGKPVFEGCALFDDDPPLECHFFDEARELRIIRRESRDNTIVLFERSEESLIESDLLYTQHVLVKQEYADRGDLPEKLRIINRFLYSENDTLILSNYRISI